MSVFQNILWGYEFTYPDDWVYQAIKDTDGFAAHTAAFEADYEGPDAGTVLVRGEWNYARRPVEGVWSEHIAKLAGMLGAKRVGSASWQLGASTGLEAEIVLPKQDGRRLWVGILARDFRILHFMVTHPKEERPRFEPLASKLIASLRFPPRVKGIEQSREGLPLPPGYVPTDPLSVLPDIADVKLWSVYDGESGIGALQAFYLREAPIYDWEVEEYVPFPATPEFGDLGFARLKLRRGERQITLGIMPFAEDKVTSSSPAKLVVKLT